MSTVGIDFKVKTIVRNDKRIKLQIWVRSFLFFLPFFTLIRRIFETFALQACFQRKNFVYFLDICVGAMCTRTVLAVEVRHTSQALSIIYRSDYPYGCASLRFLPSGALYLFRRHPPHEIDNSLLSWAICVPVRLLRATLPFASLTFARYKLLVNNTYKTDISLLKTV